MQLTRVRTYIYVLVDPFTREWRYVGKTSQLKVRLRNHCNERSNTHRSHWIQSIIRRGRKPSMKVVAEVPAWGDWKLFERMWIDYAIHSGWNLTNGTLGGDGMSPTEATRAKISAACKGRKLKPGQREICIRNLKRINVGDRLSPSTIAKMSAVRIGIKLPAAHCRQISESKRRVTDDQLAEVRRRLAAGESQASISRSTGVTQPTICAINRGKRKYAEVLNAVG